MTLEQLRIFVAVAEREHVTNAARELNLTQSAASAAIAALEERYATRFFDRLGRRIVLTPVGREFLPKARAVLAQASIAEQILLDLTGLKGGSISVAASQTVGNYWLPKVVRRFCAAHPSIDVTVTLVNTETVATLVREGGANIGFVEGSTDQSVLTAESVGRDELLLITPADHEWTKSRSPSEINLQDSVWVMREVGSGTRAMLLSVLANLGISDIETGPVFPSNQAVLAAVESGAGVAVLSRFVVENSLMAGRVVAIDLPMPSRGFFMLRHPDRYVTAAEAEFARFAKTSSGLSEPRRPHDAQRVDFASPRAAASKTTAA